jgi:hypothetical protein
LSVLNARLGGSAILFWLTTRLSTGHRQQITLRKA